MIRPPVGRPRPLVANSSTAGRMPPQTELNRKKRRSSEGSNSVASDGYTSSGTSGRRTLTPVPGPILSSPRVRTMTGMVSPRGGNVRESKIASQGKGKGRRVAAKSAAVRPKRAATSVTPKGPSESRGREIQSPSEPRQPFRVRTAARGRTPSSTRKPAGKIDVSRRDDSTGVVDATVKVDNMEAESSGETARKPVAALELGELSPVVAAQEDRWQRRVEDLTVLLEQRTEEVGNLQRELDREKEVNAERWKEMAVLKGEVESSKSALRNVTSSLKNQVRAREVRLHGVMEELDAKKNEVDRLVAELEETKQQVIHQQERQNQFVANERARADKIAEKLERSESERRKEVQELHSYYQQALHDLKAQNVAHEATIRQLDQSLMEIKSLLLAKETSGNPLSFDDSRCGKPSDTYDSPEPSCMPEVQGANRDESPATRRRRSSVKERIRELEALSAGKKATMENELPKEQKRNPRGILGVYGIPYTFMLFASRKESMPRTLDSSRAKPYQVADHLGLDRASATAPCSAASTPIAKGAGDDSVEDAPSSVEEASLEDVLLDQAHECFNEALDLCSEDKFTLAMAVLEQALGYLTNGGSPDLRNEDARMLLSDIYGQQGVCQQSLGKIDHAIDFYTRAVEVDPEAHACHANLAVLLLSKVTNRGSSDETRLVNSAREHLKQAILLDPTNTEYEDLRRSVEAA
ncbi:Kinesin-like protein kif24 [Perkinsus chesapeaki]|uniref:Kinesin-like protein kif24 n=1 Tax=Perkinsus chesapeaki TaxID=330153 RepID=A0A7J6L5B2_PERCH|nr:Kinesin-like protein kif24 [Perkinsus chesapeaki]